MNDNKSSILSVSFSLKKIVLVYMFSILHVRVKGKVRCQQTLFSIPFHLAKSKLVIVIFVLSVFLFLSRTPCPHPSSFYFLGDEKTKLPLELGGHCKTLQQRVLSHNVLLLIASSIFVLCFIYLFYL